ncbi:hypothetical protein LF95_04260 [Thalassospira sp. TSL5-1]|nr:hypothetical protein LF95_04260 [Thalassospira sp. TSL5-1]
MRPFFAATGVNFLHHTLSGFLPIYIFSAATLPPIISTIRRKSVRYGKKLALFCIHQHYTDKLILFLLLHQNNDHKLK